MHFPVKILLLAAWLAILVPVGFCQDKQETAEAEIRLANGAPIEGTFQSAAPEGLTIETARGPKLIPWKYLSAGTRWRYERPMLEEMERQRIKAEKEAKAKAEAAAKAAAAKAAAEKNNPAKTPGPSPATTATNKPTAK